MTSDIETIGLMRGSPRDLMDTNLDNKEKGNGQLRVMMMEYPKFDNIQQLVP